ncbi:GLTSCR1 domain-containing protein [Pycnococcus provasolii]
MAARPNGGHSGAAGTAAAAAAASGAAGAAAAAAAAAGGGASGNAAGTSRRHTLSGACLEASRLLEQDMLAVASPSLSPFSSVDDAIARLLPYHIFHSLDDTEPPPSHVKSAAAKGGSGPPPPPPAGTAKDGAAQTAAGAPPPPSAQLPPQQQSRAMLHAAFADERVQMFGLAVNNIEKRLSVLEQRVEKNVAVEETALLRLAQLDERGKLSVDKAHASAARDNTS